MNGSRLNLPPNSAARANFGRHNLVDITPNPAFTGFYGTHQWVLRGMKVLGRVLVFRRIAAADMATRQTKTEMDPAIS